MKKINFLFLILITPFVLHAQMASKKIMDRKAIKDMCGCHQIEFNFAETFSPYKDYKYHDNYKSGGIEWVFPIEESENKIVIQHILVIGDSMIIKHWRQDWIYENTDFYMYDKNRNWKYINMPQSKVKGQWTQKVYQVDDSPRYEGSASWVHIDGKHYWENTTDAPLPRREFSKRSDYNVMKRRNRHEITEYGWIHEQDNEKISRTKSNDHLIAKEKGWSPYQRISDSRCKLAREWWEKNKKFWADVRFVWDQVFSKKKDLYLAKKVENKMLWSRIFALGRAYEKSKNYNSTQAREKIKNTIAKYIK